MKNLILLAIVLGVVSLYFVWTVEDQVSIKGSEAVPIGTDVPKLILKKSKEILPILSNAKNTAEVLNEVKAGAETLKDWVGEMTADIVSKASEMIQAPIENKINKFLCPQK